MPGGAVVIARLRLGPMLAVVTVTGVHVTGTAPASGQVDQLPVRLKLAWGTGALGALSMMTLAFYRLDQRRLEQAVAVPVTAR